MYRLTAKPFSDRLGRGRVTWSGKSGLGLALRKPFWRNRASNDVSVDLGDYLHLRGSRGTREAGADGLILPVLQGMCAHTNFDNSR